MQSPWYLFDIEQSFIIDETELRKAYFSKQQAVHPDRMVHASAQEQFKAQQYSVALNDAYATLKDPVKRGIALLALDAGIEFKETTDDAVLLMESMESREALFEADSKEEIITLEQQHKNKSERSLLMLSTAFQEKNYEVAAKELLRYRYLQKWAIEAKAKKKAL